MKPITTNHGFKVLIPLKMSTNSLSKSIDLLLIVLVTQKSFNFFFAKHRR